MNSRQLTALIAVLGLGLVLGLASWADRATAEACMALVEARSALWSMIQAKDKSAQDALNAKTHAASSVLAGMTRGNAKLAANFKAVWDQFKETRHKEIIPAIYRGDAREAKQIASGIQENRLANMWDIMSCKVR